MRIEDMPIEIRDRGYTSSCWVWKGKLNKITGYGVTCGDGERYQTAHRWVYRKTHGEIEGRLHIDHLCRVRECVNPNHLEAVTQRENTRRGDAMKLCFADIQVIRGAHAAGMAVYELAQEFGIEKSYMSRIVRSLVRIND